MSGRQADPAVTRETLARTLRAARTAALAARVPATGAPSVPDIAYLVCACGSERYGVPLAGVAQVLPMRPCTPVPGAGPALVGLIALSGRVVGVIGLARALGRPEPARDGGRTADRHLGHLVHLRGAQALALCVDRAIGIARRAAAPDGNLGNEAASGYAPAGTGDGTPDFVVVDLPRLQARHGVLGRGDAMHE